jgi:hypothetical protein
MTNLPGFYRHTDHAGDTLDISPVLADIDGVETPVAALALDVPDGLGITIHIRAAEVDAIVAALYAAAGRKPPRLAPIQDCDTCGAGYDLGQPCQTCAFNTRMAAEQAKQ